jgi:hypothetical protein
MELPEIYRKYLTSLSSRLQLEGFNDSDFADISKNELIFDPDRINILNQEIRSFKAYWNTGWQEPGFWPDDYLIIGESGSGNYYCISKSGEFHDVLCFEHELAEFNHYADSLDSFYNLVIETMQPRKTEGRT